MPPLRTATKPVNASAVLEQELSNVVQDVLPKEDAIRKITAKLMESCVDTLQASIRDYREAFVTQATSFLQGEAEVESELLPENTRFHRRTAGAAVYVIEYKPTVRNLYFYESDEVNPKSKKKEWKPNYRLALPYMVFLPVFKFYDSGIDKGKPFFSAMCVAYRNAPLKSLRDMLYHPHLPNLGRPQHTSPFDPDVTEGDVTEFTEMVMCQGSKDLQRNDGFDVKPTTTCEMVNKVMTHFWTSRYTGELSGMWQRMQYRDAQHYGSLELWEQATQEDPLFVLKSPWVPAIRLDRLISKVLEYHDQESSDLAKYVGRYVGLVHDSTWSKLLVKAKGNQNQLAEAFAKRLEDILKKFAVEMARGMAVISNDTIRRTVQFAVTKALKESVK